MGVVIFDLDGTISDPAEGITGAINYALEAMGAVSCDPEALLCFIGPPLEATFRQLLNTSETEVLAEAVRHFRDYYIQTGYAQNTLYPGIVPMLERLKELGHRLYIATSKRQDIAVQVVEHFNIAFLFTQIFGCGLKMTKTDLLKKILSEGHLSDHCTMVGDRDLDFHSAAAVNIPSIAVAWGYGCSAEFVVATRTAHSPEELLDTIQSLI